MTVIPGVAKRQPGTHVCQAWRMVCKHHPSGCGVLMEDLGVEVPYGP